MGRARWLRLGLALGLAVPFLLGTAQIAQAAPATCFGAKATIKGTTRADHLVGTRRADVIVGLGGNDDISGLGGNDLVCGGAGADELSGDAGNDRMDGGAGVDDVGGGSGNDVIAGGDGNDHLTGGSGNDTFDGGGGWDWVFLWNAPSGVIANLATGEASGEGSDQLEDVEAIVGSAFDDTLTGGIGNDAFIPMGGDDTIDGGAGSDFVGFYPAPGPVTVDLAAGTATGHGSDHLAGIEHIDGSRFDDVLTGDANANWIYGNEGNDTISGVDGEDHLIGGDGTDTADGGNGTDACIEVESITNCES